MENLLTIDVRGTQTGNKGAQLMLEATVDRLSEFELSAPPVWSDYGVRSRLGLRQTLHDYRFPRTAQKLGNLAPRVMCERYGLVRDRDITGVVDASGYAYADAFGPW